jgi:hypothetical protein
VQRQARRKVEYPAAVQRQGAPHSIVRTLAGAVCALALVSCSAGEPERSERSSSPTSSPDSTADEPVTTSTAPAGTSTQQLLASVCTGAAEIADTGVIATPEIGEASGLAASRRNAGAWWIHNDSGDDARMFAIDAEGELLATVELDGAIARDWESIAVGPPVEGLPGEGGTATVYLGDTGDNSVIRDPSAGRGSIRIYRFAEPVIDPAARDQQVTASVDTIVFEFPEGPRDVEALMVDPLEGDLVVVTKDWQRSGVAEVYRAPADAAAGSTTTLERVGSVPLEAGTLVTAADTSPDGSVVALRSYGAVNLYERPEGEPLWAAFETVPCEGPVPSEIQGEALGFDLDGGSYLTVSEGTGQTLHRTQP